MFALPPSLQLPQYVEEEFKKIKQRQAELLGMKLEPEGPENVVNAAVSAHAKL